MLTCMQLISEDNFGELEEDLTEQFAVNVVGVAKTIAAFLPLIKKSETKKVITISTGLADLGESFYHIIQDVDSYPYSSVSCIA